MNFLPTITVNQGVVVATTNPANGVTYDQFVRSLGSYVYRITNFYLSSANFNQLVGTFKFTIFDSNGNRRVESIVSAPSPQQSQNAIFINTENKNILLNGFSNINFNILPNTSISIVLYAERISTGFDLEGYNYLKLKSILGKNTEGLFDEYDKGVSQSYFITQGRPVRLENEKQIEHLAELSDKEKEEKKMNFDSGKGNDTSDLLKYGLIGGALLLTYKIFKGK